MNGDKGGYHTLVMVCRIVLLALIATTEGIALQEKYLHCDLVSRPLPSSHKPLVALFVSDFHDIGMISTLPAGETKGGYPCHFVECAQYSTSNLLYIIEYLLKADKL